MKTYRNGSNSSAGADTYKPSTTDTSMKNPHPTPSRADPKYGSHDVKKKGFSDIRRASKRPLPMQNGDGTYPSELARPTMVQNLKALQAAGV